MKKWMKKITALSVASMTVFGLGTMSLLNVKAASPVTNLNTPATIKTINLQQFLVMKSEASSGSVGRNESLIWQQDRDI